MIARSMRKAYKTFQRTEDILETIQELATSIECLPWTGALLYILLGSDYILIYVSHSRQPFGL